MRLNLLVFALFFSFHLSAQDYSTVRVIFDEDNTIAKLMRLGVEYDHGQLVLGKHLTNVFSKEEIQKIHAAGFRTKMIIEDMEAHVLEQNMQGTAASSRNDHCDEDGSGSEVEIPENFNLGSMGGYYSYQEMLDILDDMAAQYPNLITQKAQISDIETHEGRPIYWIRVSDNPNIDEDEPEILYTSVHHAREPNSLLQNIFFIWHLLENYEDDEEIQYLLNNTELYFIPCVNPDGYVWNETTNPNGGGFWRKNRRDNGNGSMGVDLNRNYSFNWGWDNQGSSPNGNSETYRGPSAASEPETQAVQFLCNNHEFQISLNYHTFGNLLIYPWGYSDAPTVDHPIFQGFAEAMTRENNYLSGTGTETVGYTVNGDSDDWMYGEQDTKNKIYSMTPEVGPSFWPAQNQIIDVTIPTLLQNITTAHLVHNFGLAKDLNDNFISDLQNDFNFSLKKYGLKTGSLTVSLSAVSDNISWVGTPQSYGLLTTEAVEGTIEYYLNPDILNGEEVVFELVVDNGEYQHKELITKTFAQPETVFGDTGTNLDNWDSSTNWNTTTQDFVSAPSSITDSPNGNYGPNEFNLIELGQSVQLTDVSNAFLTFWGKWDIEAGWDYTLAQVSVNGNDWINLCGIYTVLGGNNSLTGEPLYEGTTDWVKEEIHLNDFVDLSTNPELQFRFAMVSDGGVEQDGFYFDDFSIVTVEDETVNTIEFDKSDFTFTTRPNPATESTTFEFSNEILNLDEVQLVIYNALGQKVFSNEVNTTLLKVNISEWESGIYFSQILNGETVISGKKLNVVK